MVSFLGYLTLHIEEYRLNIWSTVELVHHIWLKYRCIYLI